MCVGFFSIFLISGLRPLEVFIIYFSTKIFGLRHIFLKDKLTQFASELGIDNVS